MSVSLYTVALQEMKEAEHLYDECNVMPQIGKENNAVNEQLLEGKIIEYLDYLFFFYSLHVFVLKIYLCAEH